MSIFQIINEAKSERPVSKNERQWVKIGVEYNDAKLKGATAKSFAEERGIVYATFTKSMSRYASAIKTALKIRELESKPANKLSRKDRELLMINSFRSTLRDKIKNDGAAVNNKSAKWFSETIKKNIRGHQVTRPMPGKLYTYMYDAKHKDTLPYWDKFPLIVFLGMGKQGTSTLMYGLNLHYIPPKARQQFLEELLKQYSSTPILSNNTKLKIDWSKVKGFKGADKMIKAYLPSHIKGPLIEIKPADWANVVLLPLQQFQSQGSRYSATAVWKK